MVHFGEIKNREQWIRDISLTLLLMMLKAEHPEYCFSQTQSRDIVRNCLGTTSLCFMVLVPSRPNDLR